jgi:lipopolysaccharide export system protein LptC
MKSGSPWSRPLAYIAIIVVVAAAYFIGRTGRGTDEVDDGSARTPDPGYAATDAQIIETGYDGRELYRVNAKLISQQTETGVVDLETLAMDYHPGAQARVPGEAPPTAAESREVWHLTADRGQVRADGEDVQLTGNVRVSGPAPGSGVPLTMTTSELRMNTPTEYIETAAPVRVIWSGHQIDTVGMQADLKTGKLRLESQVHAEFVPE